MTQEIAIRRLLVANRGEIARRIFRTAAAMGIETVAVYASGEEEAPWVSEADHAVALMGTTAAQTYLDIDQLIEAARSSGADAVHPGYGFLSERSGFARAVIDAGLVWVGPPPDAIDAMGDKLRSKEYMADAGVPVLGSHRSDDAGHLAGTDYPLLVKASAGGGGKGMRVVDRPEDLAGAIASAQREAQGAFGDATVFIERYVTDARHVEIQILADDHGHVISCFERECSIQRRHQKVIEEAPSPAVDDDLRARMGAAAIAAARAVGYSSAGTVEFILEPSGNFWFLEVNTRLQVEHPVTEAVTGLDLVREQLRVAQGYPLSVTQDELTISGHAIEARLYAEDPDVGFLPATGTLIDWAPAPQPSVRWDSGVESGWVVGVDFDPMLAKVIAHGPTRAEAAGRLALALHRSRIRGVTTNRDFLVATLRHPDFLSGRTNTDFIERSAPARSWRPDDRQLDLAAMAAALSAQAGTRASATVLRTLPPGWRNSLMPLEERSYRHSDERRTVQYRGRRDGRFDVTVRDRTEVVTVVNRPLETGTVGGAPTASCLVDLGLPGRWVKAHVLHTGDRCWVQTSDGDVALAIVPRFAEPAVDAVAGALAAPMPGRVVSVEITTGEDVEKGRLLVIMEAMKMEHRVVAPRRGVIAEVRVKPGDQVTSGDLLVVLEEVTGP